MKNHITYSCAAALSAAAVATASASGFPPNWKVGATWQHQIQEPLVVSKNLNTKLVPDADIWDIDLWHASKNKTIVDNLHARGKTVICYFNFGAVQPEDCDFTTWTSKGLWKGPWYSELNDDKYCERFIDLNKPEVVKLLQGRLDIALEAGCDGVDPDNIDLYTLDIGVSEDKVVNVMKQLAAYGHSKKTKLGNPLLVGQKNAPSISSRLVDTLDFAVLEGCLVKVDNQPPFCNKFTNYIAQQKPVIDIEYPKSLQNTADKKYGCKKEGISQKDRDLFCKNRENKTPAGMSEVLKLNYNDFGLNACTQYCQDSKASLSKSNPNSEAVCSHNFQNCRANAELKKNCCCNNC